MLFNIQRTGRVARSGNKVSNNGLCTYEHICHAQGIRHTTAAYCCSRWIQCTHRYQIYVRFFVAVNRKQGDTRAKPTGALACAGSAMYEAYISLYRILGIAHMPRVVSCLTLRPSIKYPLRILVRWATPKCYKCYKCERPITQFKTMEV